MNTSAKILTLAIAASLLFFGSAAAYQTPINPGGDGPLSTLTGYGGILDRLYGWDNLARIDDASDQIFNFGGGWANTEAKYAGYSQKFGYIEDLNNDGFFTESPTWLFNVPSGTGNNFDNSILTNNSYQGGFSASNPFIFADDNGGVFPAPWYSNQPMNPLKEDHLVTFRIINNIGHSSNVIGNLALGWEDKPYDIGDKDFNDLVVEVSPTPEPSAIFLLGIGMLGLAVVGRKFTN